MKDRQGEDEARMTLLEHLAELRQRLLKALIALALTTTLSFVFTPQIIEILTRPIGGPEVLQAIEVTENVGVFMRVSLLSGLVLAMPVIVYQLLRFILPGLKPHERRWIFIAVPSASLLFLTGVLFAYFVMLPAALPFLIGFLGIRTAPRPANYFSFITNLMLWIGLSFEAPLIIFVLAKLKLISAQTLARQWRVAVILIAIIAAVATPTVDPINMGLLMLPLLLLYLLSILLARLA